MHGRQNTYINIGTQPFVLKVKKRRKNVTEEIKVRSYKRGDQTVKAHTRGTPESGIGGVVMGAVSLAQTLASTDDNNVKDTLLVKTALEALGYYFRSTAESEELNPFPNEELFEGIKEFQKDNNLKVDRIIKPGGETEKAINESISEQIKGATSDIYGNYTTMKKANTKNTDNYYHCKANYEATQRGKSGEITAIILGNEKEAFDYLKNRVRGFSVKDAINDYDNDLSINKIGRNKAKSGLYSSSIEACKEFRPDYLEKKYW